jgi:hypothetical protein
MDPVILALWISLFLDKVEPFGETTFKRNKKLLEKINKIINIYSQPHHLIKSKPLVLHGK